MWKDKIIRLKTTDSPVKSCRLYMSIRSVRVAEQLAFPTLDHGVAGSNPAGGEIRPEPKRRFIAYSRSCSPFHRLEMTEILLKGIKSLTHPSIICQSILHCFKALCTIKQLV